MVYKGKDFWERTAEKFGKSGYRAVVGAPTSLGLVNWYADFLQKTALKSILNNCKGARVLDVGCGVGRWSSRLSETGADVVGIDISDNMIKEAGRRPGAQDGEAKFLVSIAAKLPFGDSVFDRVFSITVLQHIVDDEEWRRSILELIRVTKSGGKIVILEISPPERRATDLDFPTAFRSTDEWLAAFTERSEAKLEQIEGVDLSIFNRPLDIILQKTKGRILSSTEYSRQLSNETMSIKFRALKMTWYILLNMAILLSLPLDLMLRNRLPKYCLHKLFIFRKLSLEDTDQT